MDSLYSSNTESIVMPYTSITFNQLVTDLSSRLGNSQFWILAEKQEYIKESLRTFNSIAQFYKQRCTFNTQNGIAFYDLTQTSNTNAFTGGTGSGSGNPPAIVGYSLTDRDIINNIQYNLMESVTSDWVNSLPAMTEMFTLGEILSAIEDARNQFMFTTGVHLTHSQVNYNPPPSDGRVSLSDSTINVRRVSWKDQDNVYSPLYLDDEQNATSFNNGWEITPSTPDSYGLILSSPIQVQVIPISTDVGVLDIVSVNNPNDLNQVVGTLLNIPDDYAWIIKYGALGDLLGKDSLAYDPQRSEYCRLRFEEGIRLIIQNGLIYQSAINGIYTLPSDIYELDHYNPTWQNSSGQPTDITMLGRNLVALSPVPNDVYSVQLDLVRNMPIEIAGFVQVGKEHINSILDYATHLAMFKCGIAEIQSTLPFVDSFMQMAMMNNEKLNAESKNYSLMKKISRKEEIDKPRMKEEAA